MRRVDGWKFADADAGFTGTAEPAEPLDEDEVVVPVVGSAGSKELSSADLSWTAKLIILALILAACFAYVRINSPRRTGRAGRHGAYEKSTLP